MPLVDAGAAWLLGASTLEPSLAIDGNGPSVAVDGNVPSVAVDSDVPFVALGGNVPSVVSSPPCWRRSGGSTWTAPPPIAVCDQAVPPQDCSCELGTFPTAMSYLSHAEACRKQAPRFRTQVIPMVWSTCASSLLITEQRMDTGTSAWISDSVQSLNVKSEYTEESPIYRLASHSCYPRSNVQL